MREIIITIKKELRSILRDKKTFVTLLLFPLLIPVMIFLYAYMYDSEMENDTYLIGIDYSLNQTEREILSEVNLKVKNYASKNKMIKAYDKGDIFGYIHLKEDGKYVIYVNENSSDGMKVKGYMLSYLEGYNTYLSKLYLIGEDIDVEKATKQIEYDVVNLEGDNFLLNLMFTIAFTYIVMSIVIATTNMATNATAVERENGTLETILTFPVSSKNLILGKYIATVIMGFLSAFIGLVLTIISLFVVVQNFSFFKDLAYKLEVGSIFVSFVVIFISSLFIAGLSIMLTIFTKSYKEAQSVSSVLNILTIIPMMISLIGISIQKWFYLIPIFNYTQMLMDVFSGNINGEAILMMVLSSVFYVFFILNFIIKKYHSEEVLFGK